MSDAAWGCGAMPDDARTVGRIDARPTLRAWLDEYAAIEREFVGALEQSGVCFAPRDAARTRAAALRTELAERGARALNGGSSVSTGFLSSACRACVGDLGSATFFINLHCTKGCYFCFNPNQEDYSEYCAHDAPWREQLEEFADSVGAVTHLGLTGGEPLLAKDEACAFFMRAREIAPGSHTRLYTTGEGLDEELCSRLAACGLDEVRFSIKIEEGESEINRVLAAVRCAVPIIPTVMVEMPVIPGTLDRMRRLLIQLDDVGAAGINVLEFCFPLANWEEFDRRGFRVKNPPFSVLYNYGYAGGLAIDGSEEERLELVRFAIDEELRLGVHYCSLDNKNRDQILQMNRTVKLDGSIYELGDDCFYWCAKAFDADVALVKGALRSLGASFKESGDEASVSFHPKWIRDVAQRGVVVALSRSVVEPRDGGTVVRELSLDVV